MLVNTSHIQYLLCIVPYDLSLDLSFSSLDLWSCGRTFPDFLNEVGVAAAVQAKSDENLEPQEDKELLEKDFFMRKQLQDSSCVVIAVFLCAKMKGKIKL